MKKLQNLQLHVRTTFRTITAYITNVLPVGWYVPHSTPMIRFHRKIIQCHHTQDDAKTIAKNDIH